MDLNDRSLRNVMVGLGSPTDGVILLITLILVLLVK